MVGTDGSVFGSRKWKEFAVLAKQGSLVLLFKINKAKRFNKRKCLQNAMAAWCSWVEVQKKTQAGRYPYLTGLDKPF